ncbi:expressed unknown protein [Seminavis robusta]|uniref:Uncharacterized protein n=1 Tax=Seminavis robusta TaxID=568900 RepID=A0A9N8D4B3_9STRA|nr:expressed unknown protein [Seminavis robusta]|eukprot:Sro1_g000800.1 n/a (390) ;mRNA; r:217940-219109
MAAAVDPSLMNNSNSHTRATSDRQQQQQLNSTSTIESTAAHHYFEETALDWFERCESLRRRRCQVPAKPPTCSRSAGWAFFRGATGNPFVDEALTGALPIMELRGDRGTGKTHTLVSLAATFAVATRPSLFSSTPHQEEQQLLPRVILLDSGLDMTSVRLASAVAAQLMLQQKPDDDDNNNMEEASIHHPLLAIERDMEDCLGRIHVAHVNNDMREWVPILEALRHELLSNQNIKKNNNNAEEALVEMEEDPQGLQEEENSSVPILLLWDDFLSEPGKTEGLQKEITRQLTLLLKECTTVGFICSTSPRLDYHFQVRDLLLLSSEETSTTTTSAPRQHSPLVHRGPTRVARTILLEQDERPDASHKFMASIVQGNQRIPYSLSSAGVLP